MKALNPSTGNLETVYVKALDSMPVGAEIDFDGQASDIPVGWENVGDEYNVYSTSEKKIGTWINGKPLYRVVVEDTTNSTASEKNIICANNVSEITKWYGDIIFATNSKLPFNYYIDSSNFSIAYTDINSSGNGRVRITTTQLSKPVIITIEYTKTTD